MIFICYPELGDPGNRMLITEDQITSTAQAPLGQAEYDLTVTGCTPASGDVVPGITVLRMPFSHGTISDFTQTGEKAGKAHKCQRVRLKVQACIRQGHAPAAGSLELAGPALERPLDRAGFSEKVKYKKGVKTLLKVFRYIYLRFS